MYYLRGPSRPFQKGYLQKLSDLYNLRIGDMVYNIQDGHNVVGVIYKVTPKYAHYAICAGKGKPTDDPHFITTGHKTKKETLYRSIEDGDLKISYAGGTKKRRKVIIEKT